MITINNFKRKKMMRHLKSWGIILLMILTFIVYILESHTTFSYQVLEVNGGYGYQVSKSGKTIIKQTFIPTKNGYSVFLKKAQAESAGKLVVKKLNEQKNPALSYNEVEKILNE